SNSAPASRTAGVEFCTVWNSILYFNSGTNDPVWGRKFENAGGSATYFNAWAGPARPDPQLLDLYHIAATSPCRAAGTNIGNIGITDIDEEPWNIPPAIGCDEVLDASLSGPLTISLAAWP